MSENLLMFRLVCAAFAANIVLANSVSAQSSVTVCGALQQSESGESDRKFLGLNACYNCHTNGFPTDGFGDRFGIMANDNWILANEVKIWGEARKAEEAEKTDKHAQAYTSLLSDTGKKIGEAMGIGENAHRDKRCLACHTGFPIAEMMTVEGQIHGLISESEHKEDIKITTGVSCEGCHGKAGGTQGWLTAHTSKDLWRFLEPEKKCEKGFDDVRSVISRTRLCLSCHLGNAAQGRVLTHEMYAAGHPPLPAFEIETFQNQMPKHWRHFSEKADDQKEEFLKETGIESNPEELGRTKSLLVAALVCRSESLRLTADVAEEAVSDQITKPKWPDFAQFDCYACHHDLRSESWRRRAQHSGGPGRPVLLPWPEVLSDLASIQITGAKETKLDGSAIQAAILKAPFGDREALVRSARATADECDKIAMALSAQEITVSEGTVLLQQIVEMAATRTLDYDSARQLVWAFFVVQEELKSHVGQSHTSPLIDEELTSVTEMFVLSLKEGRPAVHKIPGRGKESQVNEVDLEIVLPPIANYDAIAFQKAFAELRQRYQKPAEVSE